MQLERMERNNKSVSHTYCNKQEYNCAHMVHPAQVPMGLALLVRQLFMGYAGTKYIHAHKQM